MLDFFDELKEARLYRGADTLQGKSAEDLAKIAFSMIMMLEILRTEDPSFVKSYVQSTIAYENFDAMRSSASDLHNVLAVLNHQPKYENKIKANLNISVPVLQLKRYLRDIENNHKDRGQDRQLFIKLEGFFKISDSMLKHVRRSVGDWQTCSTSEKDDVRKLLKNTLTKFGQQNDLLMQFKKYIHG